MTEWWTYGLSDFLLFSPRTYYRLLERHNIAAWPAHIVAMSLGLIVLLLLRRPPGRQGRFILTILAVVWIWISWAFLWQRYAAINWVATYMIPFFLLQAVLLVGIAVLGGLRIGLRYDYAGVIGMTLFMLGLVIYPTLALVVGRAGAQAEVFGIAPDPTAIATLGVVTLSEGRTRPILMAVPVIWCLLTGATLWAMGSPEAWIPAIAVVLAVSAGKRVSGQK